MAIKLIANYSKRLGLPGYSSHQFSVSVETELVTTDDVAAKSTRLYQLLQSNVDEQMLHTGFVPPGNYGMEKPNGSNPPLQHPSANGNRTGHSPIGENWRCSDKQKDLILKLVDEHNLDKNEVDHLAHQRFGKGVKQLSKLEASGLIDELLDTYGGGIRVQSPPADAHRKRRVVALLETAVEGIASNRHHPQPGMHCSWCQYRNECKAWLPGMTVADIHRQHAA